MTAKTDESFYDGMRDSAIGRHPEHRLAEWAKAHKKALVVAGLGIAAVTAAIGWGKLRMGDTAFSGLSAMHEATSGAASEAIAVAAPTAPGSKAPHCVSAHVRNLPAGCSASAAKTAEATARGIVLKPGQTLVTAYSTGTRAA